MEIIVGNFYSLVVEHWAYIMLWSFCLIYLHIFWFLFLEWLINAWYCSIFFCISQYWVLLIFQKGAIPIQYWPFSIVLQYNTPRFVHPCIKLHPMKRCNNCQCILIHSCIDSPTAHAPCPAQARHTADWELVGHAQQAVENEWETNRSNFS